MIRSQSHAANKLLSELGGLCLTAVCRLTGKAECHDGTRGFGEARKDGVVNVAVFCLTGTMKERGNCIVKSTTGAVMEDTATVARRPLQQDSSWLLESKSIILNASLA